MIGGSLAAFLALYLVLGIVDFVLMRRYARPETGAPPEPKEELAPVPTF